MARPTKHYGKWRIRWVDENGERKSEVFDDRREASFQLQQRELEAEERRRGLKQAPCTPKTFSEVADYWEKHRIPQKRSGHHDRSVLRRHLRPAFGGVTLGDPSVWIELVDRYVVERAHLNRKTIANHLTLLITALNVAVDLGWMSKVPRIRKPKVRLISQDFSFLRTDEEIARLLRAARAEESARLARRVYRAQPEIKAARRERARVVYWEKRLLADHTTSTQGAGVKVRGARGEPAEARPTQRAPQHHVDRRFVRFIPTSRAALPREPTPTVRCSICGAPGSLVLFGPARFRR